MEAETGEMRPQAKDAWGHQELGERPHQRTNADNSSWSFALKTRSWGHSEGDMRSRRCCFVRSEFLCWSRRVSVRWDKLVPLVDGDTPSVDRGCKHRRACPRGSVGVMAISLALPTDSGLAFSAAGAIHSILLTGVLGAQPGVSLIRKSLLPVHPSTASGDTFGSRNHWCWVGSMNTRHRNTSWRSPGGPAGPHLFPEDTWKLQHQLTSFPGRNLEALTPAHTPSRKTPAGSDTSPHSFPKKPGGLDAGPYPFLDTRVFNICGTSSSALSSLSIPLTRNSRRSQDGPNTKQENNKNTLSRK
nr:uncharacterized protein LOC109024304 [Gorilla gorilla gorilla]